MTNRAFAIIDVDGYSLPNIGFVVRELAIVFSDGAPPVYFSVKNPFRWPCSQCTVSYVYRRIHGIAFKPRSDETWPVVCWTVARKETLKSLRGYTIFAKGPQLELSLFPELDIQDLTDFGCPKLEELIHGETPSHFHAYGLSHCPLLECELFMNWVLSNF
jgi:hypothetical protein